MNGIDKFSFHPSGIVLFDGCHGSALDLTWGTKVDAGTLITIGAGYIKFAHAAAAAAGLAILPYGRHFGVQTSFEANVQVVTGAGEVAINSGIRLYANVDNWVTIGPQIDGVNNHAIALSWTIDGIAGVAYLLSGVVDDIVRRVRLTVLENHVVAYVNGVYMYDLEFTDATRFLVDYVFQLVAGTTDTTDILDIRFSQIKISNKVEDPAPYPAMFKGTLSLANTTPVILAFPASEYGEMFELALAANLGLATMPYAFRSDNGAFTDITSACNDLTTGNVTLLPAVPVADEDGVYFGALAKFNCVDVYMDGGVSNLDHDMNIEYWNGGAWAAIPGVTDGTNGGTATRTFNQNGRISFSPPVDWATVAVNGVTAYWVRVFVGVAGVSVPVATHIQVGLDASSAFDHAAPFLGSLVVKMKRNFPVAGYSDAYSDAMAYLQCVGERNVDINGWRCWGNTQVSFALSATPAKTITIEYFGFCRRL